MLQFKCINIHFYIDTFFFTKKAESTCGNTCTSLTPNGVGTVKIQRAPMVSLFDSLGKTQTRVPDQY